MDAERVADYRPPLPYRAPTVDDLAVLRKGGGGEAMDRAYWSLRMWRDWYARWRWWKPWTW